MALKRIFRVITPRKNDFKTCFGNCEGPDEGRKTNFCIFILAGRGGPIREHAHKPAPLMGQRWGALPRPGAPVSLSSWIRKSWGWSQDQAQGQGAEGPLLSLTGNAGGGSAFRSPCHSVLFQLRIAPCSIARPQNQGD